MSVLYLQPFMIGIPPRNRGGRSYEFTAINAVCPHVMLAGSLSHRLEALIREPVGATHGGSQRSC